MFTLAWLSTAHAQNDAPPSAPAPAASTATDAVPTLPAVTVTGSRERGALPEAFAGGQVARGSRQGIVGNTDVFETPFSTKSYTNEFIRNQGARSLDDVVANDPSIRVSLPTNSVLDQFSLRGFLLGSNLFDGVQGFDGYSRVPVQNFERIEIFKGPTAGLVGSLDGIGGTVNRVPKRATDAPVRSVSVGATDKSLFSTQFDVGQRFGVDNEWGARVNLYAEKGEQYDSSRRRLVAPQLALDYRGEQLRVILDAGYNRYRNTDFGGVRRLAPGAAVPAVPDPRINPGLDWNVLETEEYSGLLTAEWAFSDALTAYARHGRFRSTALDRVDQYTSAIEGAGNYTYSGAERFVYKFINKTSEVGLRGGFDLASTKHQLVLSALRFNAGEDLDANYESATASVPPVAASIYSELHVPNPLGALPPVVYVSDPTSRQTGFAVADTVSLLDDRLKLTVAARAVNIKYVDYDKSRTSPTVAALYKLGGGWSIYGNYAEALTQGETAPDDAANPREQLPPYVGKQREIGAKWDAGRFGITTAYFDIRQASAFIDSNNFFRANGEQRNRGVEVETFGEPLKGTRLLGGVAYIDAKQTKTEGGAFDGNKAIGVPSLTANVSGEFDVPTLPGLTLTARYTHTGAAYVDLPNTQRFDAWNRYDLGARYSGRVGGAAYTLRVGVDNVTDKRYWAIGGRSLFSSAAPRVWKVSATTDF